MKHRPKHLVEYAFLRGLGGLLRVVPYRLALIVAAGLAWVAFHVVRFRVAAARSRIREVFGEDIDPRRETEIAWTSMRNMFFNAVEVMRLPGMSKEWLDRYADYSTLFRVGREKPEGKGAILVVPHSGNWDLAAVGANLFDLPIFLIVGRQKNLLADGWLNRMRSVTGLELIPKDSSVLKRVVRNLREGKVLAFMTDLRSKTPGIRVRFLGKEANLVGGMALFARQADVPIFPAVVTRIGWTRHRWDFHAPIFPDPTVPKEQDWTRMTQQVMDIFERAIRAEPEQYFWYNKRWVLEPLGPTPDPAPSTAEKAEPNGGSGIGA